MEVVARVGDKGGRGVGRDRRQIREGGLVWNRDGEVGEAIARNRSKAMLRGWERRERDVRWGK